MQPAIGGWWVWWCRDGVTRSRTRRRSAEDDKGRRRRTATYVGTRDEDRGAGAGVGTKEHGRMCRYWGTHKGTGTEVPVRR